MNLHCIRCLKSTNNNNNIKLKREIDRKISLYSHCNDHGFKKFKIIDEEELSDLLKFQARCKTMSIVLFEVKKKFEVKSEGCKD